MKKERLLNLAKETLTEANPKEIKAIDMKVEESVGGTERVSIILDYSDSETYVKPVSFAIASELSTILHSQEINKRNQIRF